MDGYMLQWIAYLQIQAHWLENIATYFKIHKSLHPSGIHLAGEGDKKKNWSVGKTLERLIKSMVNWTKPHPDLQQSSGSVRHSLQTPLHFFAFCLLPHGAPIWNAKRPTDPHSLSALTHRYIQITFKLPNANYWSIQDNLQEVKCTEREPIFNNLLTTKLKNLLSSQQEEITPHHWRTLWTFYWTILYFLNGCFTVRNIKWRA